jgi:hypothetical protein
MVFFELLNFIINVVYLPPDWQGKTAIQLSDVHAGIIHDKKFLNRLQKKLDPLRKRHSQNNHLQLKHVAGFVFVC